MLQLIANHISSSSNLLRKHFNENDWIQNYFDWKRFFSKSFDPSITIFALHKDYYSKKGGTVTESLSESFDDYEYVAAAPNITPVRSSKIPGWNWKYTWVDISRTYFEKKAHIMKRPLYSSPQSLTSHRNKHASKIVDSPWGRGSFCQGTSWFLVP